MLRSDAMTRQENFFRYIHAINPETILQIQKDLEPYDMISLVFLLYEIPDTALQRLIVYQRVSKDFEENNLNLLYDWALSVQSRPTWRYEFLEALTICRLYYVIRKLGFHVSNVKEHYLPNNVNVCIYINPMRKGLYKLCEFMTSDNLLSLKKTLLTYEIDTSEYETCELILLELLCRKFISISQNSKNEKTSSDNKCEVENLIRIIDNISGLRKIVIELREIAKRMNNELSLETHTINTPTTSNSTVHDSKTTAANKYEDNFVDIYQLLNELKDDDVSIDLKSDTTRLSNDAYLIKNTKRIGVCCIINQEKFHPSKDSIEGNFQSLKLDNRLGSSRDQFVLENTMKSLNFVIKSRCNLNHKELYQFLRDVVQKEVSQDDSFFMLCILSHGIRGHVYAADSVKVKVENIQTFLDSDDARKLHGIPKILILQACQVDEPQQPKFHLVADGPSANYYLRKSDFLIYWATAPEYEAYRDEKKGSIFIQILCCFIKKKATHEHLSDIFTKVTNWVTQFCTTLQRAQVPIFESTLRKKIYLHIPEN